MTDRISKEQIRMEAERKHAEDIRDVTRKLAELGIGGSGSQRLNEDVVHAALDNAVSDTVQSSYYEPKNPLSRQVDQRRSFTESYVQGRFAPEMVTKRNNSGKDLVRWEITESGRAVNGLPPFRHRQVASRIAAMLEETGGSMADQRIHQILDACEEEDSLIRESNRAKKSLASVPSGNTKKRTILETKIQTSRAKIEGIRSGLGVK